MSQAPESPERVLLVEDDAALRPLLQEVLTSRGYAVVAVPSAAAALEALQTTGADVVLTDLLMPGIGGEALLAQVRVAFPELPVIAMTAFGSVEGALALTRAGAADYLTKPIGMEPLLASVARVLAETRSTRQAVREQRSRGSYLLGIIGRSQPMQRLFSRLDRVAASPAPVLVTGETGTGKELVARAVHGASARSAAAFVPLNCGAIPPNLLESELFGHLRGAFTGADRDKQGLLEAADGGTLFLDEIAELPLTLQPKLLRVLQSGEIRRVGEVQTRHVNVRVVAATHRDLAAAVRAGTFREDLFFRVNVLRLDVPPLRERPTDIPLIAERTLMQIAEREQRTGLRFTAASVAALVAYAWPGNVRELLNVVERTAVLANGPDIRPRDLPEEVTAASTAPPLVRDAAERRWTLAELERHYIEETLRRVGGNRSRAAQLLDVPRRTLYRRLEEYGLESTMEDEQKEL